MPKRKSPHTSNGSNDVESGSPPPPHQQQQQKKQRQEPGSPLRARQSVSYGRVDPVCGQRSAIPGLDDGGDEDGGGDGESEVEGGVDGEALRYLRGVREEASGIPRVLIAVREGDGEEGVDRGIYEDGVGDARGWYEDGAYTAAPAGGAGMAACDDGKRGVRGTQEAYYESLLARFKALRCKLARVPPLQAVERLDANHSSYMSGSAKDYKLWKERLRHTDPAMAQLAVMDKGTVLKLLRMVGDSKGKYLSLCEGRKERNRMSLWIWGLLARLPERGELVSEEVGIVRELGKRAVWVGVEIKGVDLGGLKDQMDDGEEERDRSGDEEVLDVEVDGEDNDQNLPQDENEDLTNGEDMGEQDLSNSHWVPLEPLILADADTVPIIGPTLPEPLQEPTPQQSSTMRSPTRSEITRGDARELKETEEAVLEAARVRLIARIQSHVLPPFNSRKDQPEEGEFVEDGNGEIGEAGNSGERDPEVNVEEEEEEETTESAIQATKVLLDMIITIAGEVYGQRDLLEFREVWD